jgi:hypothetical protein
MWRWEYYTAHSRQIYLQKENIQVYSEDSDSTLHKTHNYTYKKNIQIYFFKITSSFCYF